MSASMIHRSSVMREGAARKERPIDKFYLYSTLMSLDYLDGFTYMGIHEWFIRLYASHNISRFLDRCSED